MPLLKTELRDELQKVADSTQGAEVSAVPEIRELRDHLLQKVPGSKASLIQKLQSALSAVDNSQRPELRAIPGLRQALTKAKQIAEAPGPNPGMTGGQVDP
jgi:hypothetical protein